MENHCRTMNDVYDAHPEINLTKKFPRLAEDLFDHAVFQKLWKKLPLPKNAANAAKNSLQEGNEKGVRISKSFFIIPCKALQIASTSSPQSDFHTTLCYVFRLKGSRQHVRDHFVRQLKRHPLPRILLRLPVLWQKQTPRFRPFCFQPGIELGRQGNLLLPC